MKGVYERVSKTDLSDRLKEIKVLQKLSFEEKVSISERLIKRQLINHKNPVLMFSGGKDSMVLLHLINQVVTANKPLNRFLTLNRDQLSKLFSNNTLMLNTNNSIQSNKQVYNCNVTFDSQKNTLVSYDSNKHDIGYYAYNNDNRGLEGSYVGSRGLWVQFNAIPPLQRGYYSENFFDGLLFHLPPNISKVTSLALKYVDNFFVTLPDESVLDMWNRTGYYPLLSKRGFSKHKSNVTGLKTSPVQCCYNLKERYSNKLMNVLEVDVAFWGNRADESNRRLLTFADNGFVFQPKKYNWKQCYPLQHWSRDDVVRYLKENIPNYEIEMFYEKDCPFCCTDITAYPNNISKLHSIGKGGCVKSYNSWLAVMLGGLGKEILRCKGLRHDNASLEKVIHEQPELLLHINPKEIGLIENVPVELAIDTVHRLDMEKKKLLLEKKKINNLKKLLIEKKKEQFEVLKELEKEKVNLRKEVAEVERLRKSGSFPFADLNLEDDLVLEDVDQVLSKVSPELSKDILEKDILAETLKRKRFRRKKKKS